MTSELPVLVAYYLLLSVLALYGVHRLYLVRLVRGPREERWPSLEPSLTSDMGPAPPLSCTVQLPLYNEPRVAARLIDACAALRYDGSIDIQVLDDSTDETPAIVAERVRFWQKRGVAIRHVRRDGRTGFKAGALAAGLENSNSDLLAIFDADFVPPPDLLTRMVPHFSDPAVGMVQARWGHLNRDETLLTRVQAIHLDSHFAVESAARFRSGRFFNFNGTAGIWRRSAIADAGGWSADTLTEDLDLSYRAQLAGWKFVFLPHVEAPAELPATLSAFQDQQHRWAKGSIQTARRTLGRVFASSQPLRVKIEAFFHLTNNTAYVATLFAGAFLVPSMLIRHHRGLDWMLAIDAVLFGSSTLSVLLYCAEGQRLLGRRVRFRDAIAVLQVGVGISVRNAAAVVEGLLQNGGVFERTPKQGAAGMRPALERRPRIPLIEIVLAIFYGGSIPVFLATGAWLSIPFLLLFLGGYLTVALQGLGERRSYDPSRAESVRHKTDSMARHLLFSTDEA